ncbi:MAG: hypothetical protein QOJ12_1295, partial [Thermoleophilales bacterium]|nr:hypothetical protein [Thermoleophilales bacterium]
PSVRDRRRRSLPRAGPARPGHAPLRPAQRAATARQAEGLRVRARGRSTALIRPPIRRAAGAAPAHSKARVFRAALGFTRNDWAKLGVAGSRSDWAHHRGAGRHRVAERWASPYRVRRRRRNNPRPRRDPARRTPPSDPAQRRLTRAHPVVTTSASQARVVRRPGRQRGVTDRRPSPASNPSRDDRRAGRPSRVVAWR